MLRHRAVLDWWIARASKGEIAADARSRMIAALALVDKWTADEIAASFDGGRFRPAALSPAEQRLARGLAGRSLTHPEMPRAVACDLPDWLEPHLAAVYGRHLEDEMAALNAPAPLDLRVNTLKADRETARRALAAEHIARGADAVVAARPAAASTARRSPATAAFKDGLVEVQDEGSQLAALLADARPGMRVVDFCAGAGGKTLALAAQMQNRGKLVACDVAAWRLERAGTAAAPRRHQQCRAPRAVDPSATPGSSITQRSFDRVFVDAPCLGIGSWRRNPDGKWRATPAGPRRTGARQRDILASAARLVKPGRPPRLRHLLAAARGERGAGRGLSRRPPRFRAVPGGPRLGGDDRRPLAGRRRLSAPDPGPPRHRRLFRRDLRAPR